MRKLLALVILLLVGAGVSFGLDMRHFVLSDSVGARGIDATTSSKDGKSYYQLVAGGTRIVKRSYVDEKKTLVVLDSTTTRAADVEKWNGYKLSGDESKILLYTRKEDIYRNSFSADYYVCDVQSGTLRPLTQAGGEQIATLSPDGEKVAFVRDNDIFIVMLCDGRVERVTHDGKRNSIINGVPDWVYQEEFGILNSLTWSSDSKHLAYLRWDETSVPMCSMQMYEGACKPKKSNSIHPGSFDYKYPCAGEANSVVTVHSYDLAARTTADYPIENAYYIPHITYFGSKVSRLAVTTLNRAQNDFSVVLPAEGKTLYREQSDIWINNTVVTGVKYYDDFMVVRSNKSGFTHLYSVDYASGAVRQLTHGDYEVTAYYGYDASKGVIYYQSTNGPLERLVRSVSLTDGKERVLGPESGTNSATFNRDFSFYTLRHSDAVTPDTYTLYKTKNDKPVRVLQDNAKYASRYCSPEVPRREFFTFDHTGYTLNGYIIKPVDFDPSKKYPCIMAQYGGPGSQEVQNNWKMGWEQYFAMNGYVVACVDGRGTGGRGKEFLKTVYLNLGKHETEDQLAAARYMMSQDYIDSTRVAIYGWSYGGFESLMCMSQPESPYAAGVAIAPVTSWKFYDTIYSERFMLTPQENPEGYARSPLEHTSSLKGDLLLIFGTADDNVRIANSMEYVAKLNSENRLIDMMIYPNMNHSIKGCDVRLPLYRKLLEFFDAKLKAGK